MKTKNLTVEQVLNPKFVGLGRRPVTLKLPRKRNFSVLDVVNAQKNKVSVLTVRNRLNVLVKNKRVTVNHLVEGRGRPTNIFSLAA